MSIRLIFAVLLVTHAAGACSEVWAQASPLNRSVRTSPSREPAIPHAEQLERAEQKLAALKEQSGSRPNILWIVVDDMGYGDPGCYGGGAAIGAATPNIDRLAREGLMLTSCYSQHTCTPTRSAILTGRLPVRTGLTRPILAGDRITKNPWDDEVSLPMILSRAGYTTLLTGKWHVGEAEGMRPHDIGFDEYYGYYPAQKELSQSVDKRRFPDLVLDEEKLAAYEELGVSHSLIHGFKGGATDKVSSIKSTEDMARADKVLADFTVEKIAELAKADKPFFLEHCFMKVHCDNFPHPDMEGLSASKYAYKDAVCEVDRHVGEIMSALRESGALQNTLVFFTSDNGPQMDAWPDAGYTPFRGAKGTTFEGGVRVPGIAYWDGMITPGRTSDDIFDLMDLFLTAVTLAEASDQVPNDVYIDSVDQTSFLLSEEGRSNRECVYFWWQSDLMGVRMREYKAHLKVILPQSTHMHIDFATKQDVGLAPWLFNLYIDPKEQMPVGHRRNAWLASLGAEAKAHAATFRKYPPKDIGLGQ
ncbi:MAG: arylsulfatase [Rubripirellula sp.]